jgi:hypothetical protein
MGLEGGNLLVDGRSPICERVMLHRSGRQDTSRMRGPNPGTPPPLAPKLCHLRHRSPYRQGLDWPTALPADKVVGPLSRCITTSPLTRGSILTACLNRMELFEMFAPPSNCTSPATDRFAPKEDGISFSCRMCARA